jgi:hypothetical protein
MSLNNDFRTNRRTYNERGGFFGQYTGLDSLYPTAGVYSLNTSSHILSTGINLLNIFALSGSVAGSSVSTTVNANSANWNSNYTTTFANSANWSGAYSAVWPNSANWNSNYTTTFANSANWSNAYTIANTYSARWNTTATSFSATSGTFISNITNSSQGNINIATGNNPSGGLSLTNLGTGGSPEFANLSITGNLSVLGDFTFLNTTVSVTSALSVVNVGTGPALFVKQSGANAPIAYFLDGDGTGEIIFANNGFVGLGTATPNNRLTVVGVISSTNVIHASGGNSDLWNSTYTSVNANSANGASVYTTTFANSANWSNAYTTANTSSANWYSTYNTVSSLSARWSSVYSTVQANSANYILDGGNTKGAAITIGTNDANILNFETNSTNRLSIAAGGNVGIGVGAIAPVEKLTVVGNISSNGTAYLSGAIIRQMLPTSTATGNRLVTVETNGTLTYKESPAGTTTLDGLNLTYNRLTKSTSTASTLTASTIFDTGSSVQIDRNVSFTQTAGDNQASNYDVQIIRNVFTGFAATTGTPLSTFPVQINVSAGAGSQLGLLYSRHNVLLYVANGNRTAFEVVAGHTTVAGSVSGTVFGIIDVGAPTLLYDVDVFNNGGFTSLLLNISSTSLCKVIVESIGYYGSVI